MIHLDTHVVAWMFAGRVDLLSATARAALEREDLAVSPMVVLELEYLFELGRVLRPAGEVLDDLGARVGLTTSTAPFPAVVASARPLTWTRDPFDRLIVGQAIADGVPLVTRDEAIRRNHGATIW